MGFPTTKRVEAVEAAAFGLASCAPADAELDFGVPDGMRRSVCRNAQREPRPTLHRFAALCLWACVHACA